MDISVLDLTKLFYGTLRYRFSDFFRKNKLSYTIASRKKIIVLVSCTIAAYIYFDICAVILVGKLVHGMLISIEFSKLQRAFSSLQTARFSITLFQ